MRLLKPRSTPFREFYGGYVLGRGERGESTRLLLALVSQAWKLRRGNIKSARAAARSATQALRMLATWPRDEAALAEIRHLVVEVEKLCNALVAYHFKHQPRRAGNSKRATATARRAAIVKAWHASTAPERSRVKGIAIDLELGESTVRGHLHDAGLKKKHE